MNLRMRWYMAEDGQGAPGMDVEGGNGEQKRCTPIIIKRYFKINKYITQITITVVCLL